MSTNAPMAALLGLAWGSFLNVCIYRIPHEQSLVYPPSACPNCGRRLSSLDLVPVLGFIILGARCRECRSRISFRYPLIEIWTSALCLFTVLWAPDFWVLTKYIVFSSLLTVLFFIDLDVWLLPNKLTLPGIAIGFLWIALSYFKVLKMDVDWKSALIGGGAGLIFFLALSEGGYRVFKKPAMGGGDIKLAFMMGLHLGWQRLIVALAGAFSLGLVAAVILLALKGSKRAKYIPFGPMLAAGGVAAAFWGARLWEIYVNGVIY